jgi:anti-sigma28 factor (negative regulator of flagellin synthesis)
MVVELIGVRVMNMIKIDSSTGQLVNSVNTVNDERNSMHQPANPATTSASSNQMHALISLVKTSSERYSDQTIQSIKSQIQQDNFFVDLESLADHLMLELSIER